MLRVGTIAVALVLVALGASGHLLHRPALQPLLWIGIVVALAIILERWRYTRAEQPRDNAWERTNERFVDPGSGKVMIVLYNPKTGDRRYVAEP